MGIFTDFRAQTSIDLTPPVTGNMRVIANDIDRLEAQFGDVDTPATFVGRSPALAILYVAGVIAGAPALGTGDVVGTLDRGNNAYAPKEVTIRALAADAAISENNTLLEEGVLNAVRYPNTPHVGQTFPVENKLPLILWSGNSSGGVLAQFGPYNIGETHTIVPDLTVSDPDIVGAELDSVICELVMSLAPGAGSWVDAPNAVAAGVTFTSGSATGSTFGWTIRGTINQINAALAGLKWWDNEFGPGFCDVNFRLSDLGHAGVGGIKQSAISTFKFELMP